MTDMITNELFPYEAVEQALGDAIHLEACDYTYKATIKERVEHYMTREPACDGFGVWAKREWTGRGEPRSDVVSVPNRRQGKDKLHRPICPYAGGAQRVDLVYQDRPDHRVYAVCQHCMKGQSTFSLWITR